MIVTLLVLAGGLGAVARFGLDGLVRSLVSTRWPLGTAVINVSGSFVLGVLTALTLQRAAPESLRLVLGTGFLGGYTTFSTASFETVRLVQEGRTGAALAYGLGGLVLGVAAAAAGMVVGTAVAASVAPAR